jgi:Family of unknown function (DUF6152)
MRRIVMRRRTLVILAGALSVLAAAPAFAHHSFAAEYDRAKPVTLTGSVTKVDWMNPHMYFYIDVKDSNGTVTNWALENGNLSGLMRRGWRKDSLKIGDVVTVEGFLAKDGSHLANARSVKLSDGRKMFSGNFGEDEAK